MCNACAFECCASDRLSGCGCNFCDIADCWDDEDDDLDDDGYDCAPIMIPRSTRFHCCDPTPRPRASLEMKILK